MTSRIALITVMTAVLSAGGLMAKGDATVRRQHGARGHFFDRMSTALNLTEQQKQQAKTIFASEREAARPIRQELRQERKSVESAIRAGKPAADVEQIAKNEGPALGNLAAIRADAAAKFYAVLTPEQQQKFASLRQEWRQRREKTESNGTAPGHTEAGSQPTR
jgi:Spy/CpxP family protein refolding chaperone